jgi:Zinc knuckle
MPYRDWVVAQKTLFIDKLYRRVFTVAEREEHTRNFAVGWKRGQDLRLLSGTAEYYTECDAISRLACADREAAGRRAIIEPPGSSLEDLRELERQNQEEERRHRRGEDQEEQREQEEEQFHDAMDTAALTAAIAAAVRAALEATNDQGQRRGGGLKGIKDAPKYDGKTDVRVWQRQFDAYAAAAPWEAEEQLRALNIVLQGSAADWLWSQEQRPALIGESPTQKLMRLKHALTARFGRILTQAADYSQLYALRQGQREGVDELVEKLDALERRLPEGVPENVKKFAFINALRPRLRLEVEKEGPDTLEDALECARRHEDILARVYGEPGTRAREEGQQKEAHNKNAQPRRGHEQNLHEANLQRTTNRANTREWSPVGPDGQPWRRRGETRNEGVYSNNNNNANFGQRQQNQTSARQWLSPTRYLRESAGVSGGVATQRGTARTAEEGSSSYMTRAETRGSGRPNSAWNQRRQEMSPALSGMAQKSVGETPYIARNNSTRVGNGNSMDTLTERMGALSLNRAGQRQEGNYRQGWKCYNCGQSGHLRKECPF